MYVLRHRLSLSFCTPCTNHLEIGYNNVLQSILLKMALTFVLNSLLFDCHYAVRAFRRITPSSAALGQQRTKVTRQQLVRDWLATSEVLYDVKPLLPLKYRGKFVQGVNTMAMKHLARLSLHYHCILVQRSPPHLTLLRCTYVGAVTRQG